MTAKNEVPSTAPAVIDKPRYKLCEEMGRNPDVVFDQRKMRAAVMEEPIQRLIAAASPANMRRDASRLAQSMIVEMGKQPKLLAATAQSLLGCLVQASSLGLQFGGPLGQAYLVPYWNSKKRTQEAQLQVGYKGYIYLAHNSDAVAALDAHPVYEGEVFRIQHGTDESVVHEPRITGVRKEEELIGVYAYWVSKSGRKQVEWMTRDELLAHRDRYAATRTLDRKESTPWWTNFVEMARKTPLRLISKRIPVSTLQEAASLDEIAEDGLDQRASANIVIDAIPSVAALSAEESLDLAPGEYVKNGQVLDAGGMFVRDYDGR